MYQLTKPLLLCICWSYFLCNIVYLTCYSMISLLTIYVYTCNCFACENVSSGICGQWRPDQTAHPCSLIRAFTVRLQNHWIPQNVWMKSKGQDDTLSMCRMIWICTFCTCLTVLFHLVLPIWAGLSIYRESEGPYRYTDLREFDILGRFSTTILQKRQLLWYLVCIQIHQALWQWVYSKRKEKQGKKILPF